MKKSTMVALIALSGCSGGDPWGNFDTDKAQDVKACQAAETYAEAFGTPDDFGPCVNRVRISSRTGNFVSYSFTTWRAYGSDAIVTWQNDRIISVTEG